LDSQEPKARIIRVLAAPPVALLTTGAVIGSAAIAAVAVHLGYLRLSGYSPAIAAAVTGSLGLVQVGGRVVMTTAARRVPAAAAAAVLLAAQAVGVAALLLITGPIGLGSFVLLFGLGYGVLSIARPDLLARYAERRLFARLSGVQALLVILGEAAGPAGATGSYTPVFIAIAAASACSAGLLIAAERACCPGILPSGRSWAATGRVSAVPLSQEAAARRGARRSTRSASWARAASKLTGSPVGTGSGIDQCMAWASPSSSWARSHTVMMRSPGRRTSLIRRGRSRGNGR
jgi:hypothetical protein